MKWAMIVTGLIALVVTLAGCSAPPSPQQITSKVTARCGPFIQFKEPAWSPKPSQTGDESQIVYVAHTYDTSWKSSLWIMTPSGKSARQLTEDLVDYSDRDYAPAWSPDGTKIAFVSYHDGNAEIYTMNSDGTQQTRLTDDPAPDLDPVWSPDGKRIAFLSGRTAYPYKIYVMDSDGGSQTPLVGVSQFEDMVWTPDGKQLIYGDWHEDAGHVISSVDTHSGVYVRLTDDHVRGAGGPSVSPDGQQIAFFARQPDSNLQIYVMNIDGTGVTQLTHDDAHYTNPAWSPDGKYIAYMSSYGNIHIMDSDGTNQQQLTHGIRWINPFVWSPDSSRILFTAWPSERVSELYMINADGSGQVKLSHNPGTQTCFRWPF